MTEYNTQVRKPLNEQDFEKHSTVLFRVLLKDPNVKRVGRRGLGQKGVDLVGNRNRQAGKVVGIQCKLKGEGKKLSEAEVRREVTKALKFRPKLTEYFIVTTAGDDTAFDELTLKLQQEQKKKGRNIKIAVWGWETVEQHINENQEASRNDRELAINTAMESGDWGYIQSILASELVKISTLDAPTLIRLSKLALESGSPYVDQFRNAALERFPDNPYVFLSAYTLAVERGVEQHDEEAHLWFQKAVARLDKP